MLDIKETILGICTLFEMFTHKLDASVDEQREVEPFHLFLYNYCRKNDIKKRDLSIIFV